MFIAAYLIELLIPGAKTLKDRRQVVSGIKDRLAKKGNFSIVELADNDLINKLTLGAAFVSSSYDFAIRSKELIEDVLDGFDVSVISFQSEIFEMER